MASLNNFAPLSERYHDSGQMYKHSIIYVFNLITLTLKLKFSYLLIRKVCKFDICRAIKQGRFAGFKTIKDRRAFLKLCILKVWIKAVVFKLVIWYPPLQRNA